MRTKYSYLEVKNAKFLVKPHSVLQLRSLRLQIYFCCKGDNAKEGCQGVDDEEFDIEDDKKSLLQEISKLGPLVLAGP